MSVKKSCDGTIDDCQSLFAFTCTENNEFHVNTEGRAEPQRAHRKTVFPDGLTVGIPGSAKLRAGENECDRGLHLKNIKETVL